MQDIESNINLDCRAQIMERITLAKINERLQIMEQLLIQLLERLDEGELSDEALAALAAARATPLREYVPLE